MAVVIGIAFMFQFMFPLFRTEASFLLTENFGSFARSFLPVIFSALANSVAVCSVFL
jgi:hypothetical protein